MFIFLYIITALASCTPSEPIQERAEQAEVFAPFDLPPKELPLILFTDPQKVVVGEKSNIIMDNLIELVHATPAGADIHLSIFLFEHDGLTRALNLAHSRGVELHIMVDGSDRSNNAAVVKTLTKLGEGVEVVEIRNSNSSTAINHNKFVLFSELIGEDDEMKHVVFQASQNFTEGGSRKLQDAVVLSNTELYQAYLGYWYEMQNFNKNKMRTFTYSEVGNPADDKIAVQFFPRLRDGEKAGGDTVVELLDRITNPQGTTVSIGMSAWDKGRMEIIDKLNELLKQGARIEIYTKNAKEKEIYEGLKQLKKNGAYVKMFNIQDPAQPMVNIHLKLLLIKGELDGKEETLVMTGSHNFTGNALWNNNEVALFFSESSFYNAYLNYLTSLRTLPDVEIP